MIFHEKLLKTCENKIWENASMNIRVFSENILLCNIKHTKKTCDTWIAEVLDW
jgi:hypothetical protein